MSGLAIYMLGMPLIEYAGDPLVVDRRKAVALLIYLAMTDGAHGRDALATLLWPGYDQSTARGNLRRTLSVLHNALGEEWLAVDCDSVALRRRDDLWIDVQAFERLLAECRAHGHLADQVCPHCLTPLNQAVTLYRDDFLTGFTLPDAPDFDDWQRYQTEGLRGTLSGALERVARCLAGQEDFNAALTHVRRRVALDPLDENSQRQLMQTLAWAGDRGAALRQYQACVELLRREVQAAPAPETTALYQAISQNRLEPPTLFPQPEPLPQPAPHPRPLPAAGRGELAPPSRAGLVLSLSKEKGAGGLGGELRPVTILCAGLAGEAEPEAAAAGLERLLTSLETILGRYEARLDRLLGDSVMAVFGAGQTHEDDVERAVGAALALIEAGRGTSTRPVGQSVIGWTGVSAGIATGEAYFGPVGAGEHAAVSVLGPLVNRAARLQGRAAAGQVLADQPTQRQTRQAFHYRQMDAGAAAAPAYVVEGVQARPMKTRGIEGLRAALTGREEELAKLSSALAKVRAGQGQVVALIGEPGLGKSRLVAELKARSDSAIITHHSSLCNHLAGRPLPGDGCQHVVWAVRGSAAGLFRRGGSNGRCAV